MPDSGDDGFEELGRKFIHDAEGYTLQVAPDGKGVFCDVCEMWLNGLVQWEDHKIGKKHRKNLEKLRPTPATATASLQRLEQRKLG